MAIEYREVAPNIFGPLSTELGSCHLSGASNFEAAPIFLGTFYAPNELF